MDIQTIHFISRAMVFLLGVPCIITYLLFAWDKHLAAYQRQRVPEALLFTMSALFGAFGALCAMIFFRHKTQHRSFLIVVPLLAVLQVALVVLFKLYVDR